MISTTVIVFLVLLSADVPVQGQTCQEQCRDDCGTTGLTRDGSEGRIINIAYGKPATVSSILTNAQGTSGPGCMLVNGRTSTVYMTITEGNANCVHTTVGDFDASWFVDLGRQYTIDNITIFRRSGLPRRMSGMSVLVENGKIKQTCYAFPNATTADNFQELDALPEEIDITCDPPLTGQRVWLQKHGEEKSYDTEYYLLNVCEVQVWGCKVKLYGPSCDMTCNDLCGGDGSCFRMSGVCVQGCVPGSVLNAESICERCSDGRYGEACAQQCGSCKGVEACNAETGVCPDGCQPGMTGTLCKDACSGGTYGEKCGGQCGLCKEGEACDTVTGHCSACQTNLLFPLCQVCDARRHGSFCDMQCSDLCGGDGSCDRISSKCVQGCVTGYVLKGTSCEKCGSGLYGDGCGQKCGQCSGSLCRHDNGTCEAGCVDGFDGPMCKDAIQREPDEGPDIGLVAGGAVAGVVVLLLVMAVVLFVVFRRSRLMSDPGARNTKSAANTPNNIPNNAAAERSPPEIPADQGNPYEVVEDDNHYEVAEEAEGRYINVMEDNFYDPLQAPDEEGGAAYSQLQVPKKEVVLYQNQPHTPREGDNIEARYHNT